MVLVGEIHAFPWNYVPIGGWIPCDGRILLIKDYANSLYPVIGSTYGGDGQNNFAVPDLRGRVPIGAGQGDGLTHNYGLGQAAGVATLQLKESQIPTHNHYFINDKLPVSGSVTASMSVNNDNADTGDPRNNFLGNNEGGDSYASNSDGSKLFSGAVTVNNSLEFNSPSIRLTNTGGYDAVDIVQPTIAINWMINYGGQFPY